MWRAHLLLWSLAATIWGAPAVPFEVIDLDAGTEVSVRLHTGQTVSIRLESVAQTADRVSDAVRLAVAHVRINGKPAVVECANYRLPARVGDVQVDCPVAKVYYRNAHQDAWGLEKDVRLRLWPKDSPWMPAGTYVYPVRQRWFATHTQMSNEPTYVDAGESPKRKRIYYHSGLDIGGCDQMTEVVAATEGLVVSLGERVLDGHRQDTPVAARYDVIYLLDEHGWYYRYSHLDSFDPSVKLGDRVKQGQKIGTLGKEGASGGWSHLHWEIKSRQPSGKWGTQEGYAFLWEAYLRQYQPEVIAVSRPHYVAFTGEKVRLDGSRSWSKTGGIRGYQWTFTDGVTESGAIVERTYSKSGTYSEVLQVTDANGRVAYDFAIVNVFEPGAEERLPPTIHASFFPSTGIRPGQEVTFKVRTFRTTDGEEVWDFGDGSPRLTVKSDGNVMPRAKDGYAVVTHRYDQRGDYIVRVERGNCHGQVAVGHVWVRIEH